MKGQLSTNMDIDYEALIFHKKFQKIQPVQNQSTPILVKHWITHINPKESPIINRIIKEYFKETSETLKHLKRFVKFDKDGKVVLKVLLCDCLFIDYTDLHNLLVEQLQRKTTKVIIEKADIPVNKPFDKELNAKWSNEIWPIVWKGNPMIQELNESYKNFKPDINLKYLHMITENSNDITEKDKLPVVTIFVDPKTDTIMSIQRDSRSFHNPVKHSIMNCIEEIATKELDRRTNNPQKSSYKSTNNYLCLNYHVYTTHEPCTMCSMALLHSRIAKLVYINDSKMTGSIGLESGNKYMIHLSCSLNWKFESYKYIGTDLLLKDVDKYIEV